MISLRDIDLGESFSAILLGKDVCHLWKRIMLGSQFRIDSNSIVSTDVEPFFLNTGTIGVAHSLCDTGRLIINIYFEKLNMLFLLE